MRRTRRDRSPGGSGEREQSRRGEGERRVDVKEVKGLLLGLRDGGEKERSARRRAGGRGQEGGKGLREYLPAPRAREKIE